MSRWAAAVLGFLFSASAFAECGGQVQCIGVGATAAAAAANHHNGIAQDLGAPSATLTFATQTTGTTSASQTIHVAAVAGAPAGRMAVLGPITITGANASEFTVTGGTCSTTNGPIHGGATCTITVAFNPFSAGARSALLNVPLDPPASPGISGRSVGLSGTGFGPDVVAPRANPSTDAKVIATVRAQTQAQLRFGLTQISNIQNRMESLRTPGDGREPSSAGGASPSSGSVASTGVWVGGSLNFGRLTEDDMSDLRFRTSGVSLGVDHRLGQSLTLGIGAGLARDKTAIANDGSETKASGQSAALYGTYRPAGGLFVDALVGLGRIEHETARFVTTANDFARSERDGKQTFGSITAGYDYRREGFLLSPYLRFAYTREKLDETTETGAGTSALTYFQHTFSSSQAGIGLRAQSRHETGLGWAQPRAKVEFVRDSISDRAATVAFADQLGTEFSISPLDTRRNSLLWGVGTDFVFRRGLTIGIDYLTQRLPGPDSNQAIRLWLSQDLDGRAPGGGVSAGTFETPITVEAAYLWDNNLNRAPDAGPKLGDHVFSLNGSSAFTFPLTGHTRLLVSPFFETDKLYQYDGLDRASLGAQADLQYRTSAAFTAPTLSLFARGTYDDYRSELRTGKRWSFGLSARQSWTDRIDVFGAIARNVRDADNAVWDTKDTSVRLNLDYAIGPGTLYLGGQYSSGDAVSTVGSGFETAVASKATVRDDAYGRTLFAHRYDARTWVGTLGYNFPLGARDSLDLSLRHARAKPVDQLGGGSGYGGGEVSYSANQFLLSYLTRF